jgi:hypothetical protein
MGNTRRVVTIAAVAAVLLRFPGLMWPIRPDEAGFTLVARAWDARPDSLYGTYWVDRPPPLIALVRLSDWVGGPLFIRVVAALGCALLVVAAARTAYLLAGARAARWTAVGTVAVTSNTMIDAVSAKGEILGIPLVVTSFWLALEALRVLATRPRAALALAAGAGLLGMATVGLKQNMVTGLAFGGVLLLASALLRRISWGQFWQLAAAALTGAAVPLVATVAWCVLAGVHLETLWYAVYGFRGDALSVIADDPSDAPRTRAIQLSLIVLGSGMALLLGVFLHHLPRAWRRHALATAATVAVLLVDGAGLLLGGSYWRPYLFGLVPAIVLGLALTTSDTSWRGRVMRTGVVFAVASCVLSFVGWVASNITAAEPPTEVYTGEAIAGAAEPGDTIVVFGGRSDIVFASGLESPYPHLWSLPMRTLDPRLEELEELLASDRAPTWFVVWVPLTSWDETGHPDLVELLVRRYDLVTRGCDDRPVWLRSDVERPVPEPDCDQPWGFRGAQPGGPNT